MISRNGESITFNATGMARSSHSRASAEVSAGSTLTVTASMVSGRVARA